MPVVLQAGGDKQWGVKALPCEEHEASLAGKADKPSCAEQETRLNERIESLPCAAHESKLAEKADKADLDRRDAKMSERIDRLPCEQHGKDIGGLLSFERSFMAMSERFDEVCKWLMKFDGSTIDTIAPKHSPRRMNRAGLEIFEETGARKALEDNLFALLLEMEKKSPETAYDVEDRARGACVEHPQAYVRPGKELPAFVPEPREEDRR